MMLNDERRRKTTDLTIARNARERQILRKKTPYLSKALARRPRWI